MLLWQPGDKHQCATGGIRRNPKKIRGISILVRNVLGVLAIADTVLLVVGL